MIRDESIRIPFRYACGETSSRFLLALRDEQQIVGSRCSACQRVTCPAVSFCNRCGEATPEMTHLSGVGALVSWTELPCNPPGSRAYGLVLLDGADTAMMHRLLGRPESWTLGARIRVRFAEERTGSVLDIEGFEPVPLDVEEGA